MTDTALDLVERVLPVGVPVRQWVCSLPWGLRALCGYDRRLCADVVRAFVVEVSRSLRRRAKRELGLGSMKQAHTGAVAVIQRFDSALRLNVHAHVLFLDGVYVRDGDADGAPLVFHELPAPTGEEVAEVAHRSAERIKKVLRKHGRELDPEMEDVEAPEPAQDHPALTACYQAAIAGLDLFGPRASAPSLRLVDPSLARPEEPVAVVQGVNVHAKLALHGNDRARLERLCRYLARPPIAIERLIRLVDGRVRYEMKKAWRRRRRRGTAPPPAGLALALRVAKRRQPLPTLRRTDAVGRSDD